MNRSGRLPSGVIDLNQVECRKFFDVAGGATPTYKLSGWADGIAIARVGSITYLPEYGVPIVDGFCPEESIGYAAHLDLRLGANRSNFDSLSQRIVEPDSIELRDEEAAILGNPFSHVFGHWLEELFRVVILESVGFSGSYVLPSWYSPNYTESLEVLRIPHDRILKIDRPTTFRNGILTSNPILLTINQFPKVAVRLRQQIYDAVDRLPGAPERVWAMRGTAANGRRLVNEEEVHDCVRHHGFDIVDYATLSFRDQVALDRGTKVLAGPHGSALLHSAFMPDNGNLLELLSPFYVNPSNPFCFIFNHRYAQVVGFNTPGLPYAHGQDIYIDTNQIKLALSLI